MNFRVFVCMCLRVCSNEVPFDVLKLHYFHKRD